MIHVHYVTILIVRRNSPGGDELLMARRAAGKYLGGTWQLISGGLEPDEAAWRGALREMREETGLTPREFYRLSTLTSFYRPDNDSLNVAPMFCAIVESEVVVRLDHEHTDVAWVPLDAAAARLMWPADRHALEEVRTVILGDGPAKAYLRIALEP
jgi:dihydroneopterin triphosphate diphosphatase